MKLKTVVAAMLMALAAVVIASGCKQTVTVPEAKDKTPPKEVTNLKAVTGDGKISLSWTNPTDADLHQVEITASPAAGSLTNPVYLSAEKGKAMSFTAEGLSNGTAYTFTVKTIDKALNKSTGVKTETAVAPIDTSDKTPPAEVTTLKGDAGNGKVLLSWKNPGDADLYQVEISASPAVGTLTNPVYLSAAKGSAGSFMAEGLTGGQEYTFTVKTIDKTLNVGTAVTVKATPQGSGGGSGSSTADTTAPAEVTELTAIAGNGKVSLSWKNPGDADLYQVEVSASPVAGSLTNPVYLSAVKGAAGSFMAEGLTGGQEYTFTVKTIDKTLNVGKAVTVKATPENTGGGSTIDTTAPAEVTNLQAEALAGAIRLTWSDPTDADLWGIEITSQQKIVTRSIAPIPENAILVAKGEQSRKISNLTVGQSYTFTVKTIDNSGNKSAGTSTTTVTPKAGEPMTLTPEQNPAKETWTKDSVTITVKSNTSIKKAKWKKGSGHSAKDVLENGNSITGNSFTVSENGIYSVAVQDNDGRREVETIEIKNIDKEPPAKVKSLSAVYDSGNQKIIVTWINPTDSDFAGLTLRWKKEGGEATNVPLETSNTSYEIHNITADGSTYTITVSAKDEVGNESKPASVSVIASSGPSLTGIELSRAHLVYNDTDLTITATLKGSNFDLIASQSDSTVKVGIFKDNALVGSLQTASPDGANYKVTLTAPTLSSSEATVEGAVYTVKVKLCGTYQSVTETFVISKEARLIARPELSVTQIASSEVTSSSTTKITLKGINLDIAGGITVQLYDSNGAAKGSAVPIDTSHTGRELTTLTADIPIPSDEGVFTAKVLFGGVIQTSYYEGYSYNSENTVTNPTIQVYGSPKFTSFTIPNAGISKEDGTVTAVVKGANFKAPGVSETDFSVSCAEKPQITNGSAITIIDDTTLKVSLTIPGTANDYTITVKYGAASKTGTFSVKDYTAYTVGKIVRADNTLVDKDSYTAIDSTNPPVGIICGPNSYGVPRMIALHISGSSLEWAKSGSTGNKTKFEGITCTSSQTGSGAAQTATFTGDTDGSDNWEYIKQQDPAGAADAATNYPAFHWVNTYNETYKTQLNNKTFAWYMPSLAELCEVYKNREVINASLEKINRLDSRYADTSLSTSAFWSSSQDSHIYMYTWYVSFRNNGYLASYRSGDYCVCCVAGF